MGNATMDTLRGWAVALRLGLAVLAALAIWTLVQSPFIVHAHGDLESSDPKANAVLTDAPEEVVVNMTESPDLAFSEIKVFNKDGVRVDSGGTRSSGETGLVVSVEAVEPGTYTAVWEVTSVSDGHRSSGLFRFTVSGGGRLFLGTGAGVTQASLDTRPTFANTAIRLGDLIGLSLATGAIGALLFVWKGAKGPTRRRMATIALVGLGAVAVALAADVVHRAVTGPEGSSLIDVLVHSQTGRLALSRMLLAATLALLWTRTLRADAEVGRLEQTALVVLTALLLLGRSLGGHAGAATGGALVAGVGSDFAHLSSAALWAGGLVALLAGLRPAMKAGSGQVKRAITRFSALGLAALALIAVTGLYNAWIEVGSIRALTDTGYGRLLIVKTVVLVPILALGAFNLFGFSLAQLQQVGRRFRLLSSVVSTEATLAVVVLVAVALLANLPVGRDAVLSRVRASDAPMAMPVLLSGEGTTITFGVTPNMVGTNTFLVELTDRLGRPVEGNADVEVQISRLDQGVEGDTLVLDALGDGRFSARSDALSIVGTWSAHVRMARSGREPVAIDYLFRVADRPDEGRPILDGIVDFLTGREPELPRTGPLVPSDDGGAAGLALLRDADFRMNGLTSVHECNNINGVITLLDYSAPDRMRYVVDGGGRSVIAGSAQWYRRGTEAWRRQDRPRAFEFPSFTYGDDATGVRGEGSAELDGRPHNVVSFFSVRDDADYWFWIDAESLRISRLVMNVPPTHYMVSTFERFDAVGDLPLPLGESDVSSLVPDVPDEIPCRRYLP